MISQRAKSLKASPTLALVEPDWPTFAPAAKAGIEAIQGGFTKYVPSSGTPEIKTAISKMISEQVGITFDPTEVTVSAGAKFIIFSALHCLCDPGDEVIFPSPYWVSYPSMVELADGKPIVVATEAKNNFKMTPQELGGAITEKTKAVLLNSPSNPTGEVYSVNELRELAAVLKENPQIVVICDDIYNQLYFGDESVAPHLLQVAPELRERTLLINGVSKAYSMTGWRLGWAVGPKDLIGAMTRYSSQSATCAPSMAQAATVAALKADPKEIESVVEELKIRKSLAQRLMAEIPGVQMGNPEGAFYGWLEIKEHLGKSFRGKTLTGSSQFSAALLEDTGVVVVPGIDFGMEGYIRISYVVAEEKLREALRRMASFLQNLKR
jgi:aspartate aminotransferase